jgi:hypothetical protein
MLTLIFLGWAAACVAIGVIFLRRAPAISLALFGSLVGAVAGFLIGNVDGPAEVPAYTAVAASAGLVVNGLVGLLVARGRPTARSLWRAAIAVILAAPFAAGTLTFLLQTACPLYVSGKGSGFCDYQGADLLGGWVSGVIVAFLFDAVFVAGLLMVSAWQARVQEAEVSQRAERHMVVAVGPSGAENSPMGTKPTRP